MDLLITAASDAWSMVSSLATSVSTSVSTFSENFLPSSPESIKALLPGTPPAPRVPLQVAADYIEVEVSPAHFHFHPDSDGKSPNDWKSQCTCDCESSSLLFQSFAEHCDWRAELARKKALAQPKDYKIWVNGEFKARGPGPIIVIPNLTPDKIYHVSVSAVNGAGESPRSEEIALKTANHGIGVDESVSAMRKGAEHLSVHSDLDENSSIKLARALNTPESEGLRTLMLYGNHCGKRNSAIIAAAFTEKSHLRTLLFGRNQVHEDALETLTISLRSNSTITSLILVENRIDANGAKMLANLLLNNSTLRHLDLRKNPLYGQGGANLAEGLQWNDSLTSIDVSGCKIGDEGAEAIAKALGDNTTLTSLKMSSNDITGNGALEVARYLGDNVVIKQLVLSFGSPQRTEWVARHEDPLLSFLPNARRDWLETVLPAWTSFLTPIALTQHSNLGNDAPLFFLGVLLPEVADLICPSFLETVVEKFVPPVEENDRVEQIVQKKR